MKKPKNMVLAGALHAAARQRECPEDVRETIRQFIELAQPQVGPLARDFLQKMLDNLKEMETLETYVLAQKND